MKKLLAALLLLTVSIPAFADWFQVTESDFTKFYVNLGSINRQAGMVQVIEMLDFSQPQVFGGTFSALSGQSLSEYDCVKKRVRTLSLLLYSENMAAGKAIYSNLNPGEWVSVDPGTPGEEMFKVVCMKMHAY